MESTDNYIFIFLIIGVTVATKITWAASFESWEHIRKESNLNLRFKDSSCSIFHNLLFTFSSNIMSVDLKFKLQYLKTLIDNMRWNKKGISLRFSPLINRNIYCVMDKGFFKLVSNKNNEYGLMIILLKLQW